MIFMISYDISCGKRRSEIKDILSSYLWIRVQKSVYFSTKNERFLEKILQKIEGVLDKESDKLLVLPICDSDFERSYFFDQYRKKTIMRERSYID